MKNELLENLLQLNTAERVRMAQTLWESVEQSTEIDELSDEQKKELLLRLEDFQKNGSKGRPWKEALKSITTNQ